jgi:hypothetical protein
MRKGEERERERVSVMRERGERERERERERDRILYTDFGRYASFIIFHERHAFQIHVRDSSLPLVAISNVTQ